MILPYTPPLDGSDPPTTLIGYFERDIHGVTCVTCAENGIRFGSNVEEPVRVYLVNILPHNQDCQRCGRVIVQGNKRFPQLFVQGDSP